jgi:type II secretory pathway component GspD/PulD (secretin)
MNARKIIVSLIAATAILCSISFAAEQKTIEIYAGETTVLKFAGVTRLAIGNPEVADVTAFPENPDDILINAKKPGVTNLTVWDASEGAPYYYAILVSSVVSGMEQRTYLLKHYQLTYTVYNEAGRTIENKPDDAGVANLNATLKPILGDGNYSIDITRNRILMKGSARELDAATATLNEIDKPLRQVMIEARVIEISKDDLKKLGNMLTAENNRNSIVSDSSGDSPSFVASFDTLSDLARHFSITMDTLRTAEVGRTLVNTKIAVLDGKTAWILSGEKIPIATRDSEQGLVSYDYISTGIGLAVSPRVGYDGTITLWIRPEVSSISGWVGDPDSSSDNAAPIIDTREAMSDVRVRDGGTILIGGLQRDAQITSSSKVPLLGDLPAIGSFFRKKRVSNTTSELVIVITPHIMGENESPDLGRFGVIDMPNDSQPISEGGLTEPR